MPKFIQSGIPWLSVVTIYLSTKSDESLFLMIYFNVYKCLLITGKSGIYEMIQWDLINNEKTCQYQLLKPQTYTTHHMKMGL